MGITFSDLCFLKFNYDIYADLITSSTLISLLVRMKDLGFTTKFISIDYYNMRQFGYWESLGTEFTYVCMCLEAAIGDLLY